MNTATVHAVDTPRRFCHIPALKEAEKEEEIMKTRQSFIVVAGLAAATLTLSGCHSNKARVGVGISKSPGEKAHLSVGVGRSVGKHGHVGVSKAIKKK